MKRFDNGQKVRVVDAEHPLAGRVGRVCRLRMGDNGAWVAMADDVPDDLRSFPANDPGGRGNNVLLYPEECEAA